jgi:hypothetical protein
MPEGSLPRGHYNEGVRYYTTKPLRGSIDFKCIFCGHNVTTQDFDSLKGNCRTQAAAVMNQHALDLHLTPRPAVRNAMREAAVACEVRLAEPHAIRALPGVRS